jgi:2-polyprenyl-3-methyl-5-hydroxy-6-metoxy-1,4-benzoquinol methylase
MPVGSSGRPLRVLDIATGAGDVPIGLWRRAVRTGVPLEVAGCDLSPGAVRHAKRQAGGARAPVRFFQLDALRRELPSGYDVLICSLFLHHLDNREAVELLGKLSRAARHLVLVNDLRREAIGWLLAWSCPRLLTASPVVHTDAVLSVRAAFTLAEMRELAVRAGLHGATIAPRWPRRLLLCWRKGGLGDLATA